MPSSPIMKEIELPDNWVHLQKTMIPDSSTCCYFSVWYDPISMEEWKNNKDIPALSGQGTAWLMWCPFHDDPTVNDNWGHVEDLEVRDRNVLTAIESVYGVSFHESIWQPMTATEV